MTISYDAIGNPLSDGTWYYTWEQGCQLQSMESISSGAAWIFTYNADGMRTKRTNGSTTYNYTYHGSQLTHMERGSVELHFSYDASGSPMAVVYNNNTYYYLLNQQGDVAGILDSSGTQVVAYTYDAWGRPLSTTGTMASSLGQYNPLRYRGYVYDQETQLYYLQSRYYNPELGRFINADTLVSTGQGILGNNMFAYCRNNPVKRKDATGTDDVCVANADDMDTPLNDLGYTPGGGYANAYNSIDAGYHYGVDFSMASNSSLTTGGIYGNGYTAYGTYSSPTSSGYSSTSTTSACSNPYGKKGGPEHQGTIAAIKSDLISRGYSVVEEYRVDTSGGHKNTRYLDIYASNGFDSFGVQVGRMTRSGLPVARERRALSDINDSGIPTIFVRYK